MAQEFSPHEILVEVLTLPKSAAAAFQGSYLEVARLVKGTGVMGYGCRQGSRHTYDRW